MRCTCRYGFNPGSALAIIGYGPVVALCAINTTLAAAAGTVSALLTILIINLIATKHVMWDLIGASNGTLGGLVGITAGCSVVDVCTLGKLFHSVNTVCSLE
jgi:ammonium transporter, Amt family